ncbi:MAG: oligosaccharide flippase family protein, partial [bacterium]
MLYLTTVNSEGSDRGRMSAFVRGATDDEKVTRFVAGGIVSILGFMAGGVFQTAWFICTTRILGARDMGIFGPIFSFFMTGASLVSLGVPQTTTTYVSHHFETDPEESKKFVCDGMKLLMILSAAVLVLGAGGAGALFAAKRLDALSLALWMTISFSIIVSVLFWGVNGTINGYQRLDYVAIGNIAFPVGMFASTLTFMLLAQAAFGKESTWDVVGAASGMGVGPLFGLAAALVMFRRMNVMPASRLFSLSGYHGLFGKILVFGGLSAVAMVSNTVLLNFSSATVGATAKLGWLAETADENLRQAGYFSTGFFFAMVPMLIMGLTFALVPAISEAEARKRHDLMQKYYNLALKYSFGIIILFLGFYGVKIGQLVELISGPEYPAEAMASVTMALSFGGAMFSLIFLMTTLFIGLKRPHIPAIINIAALTVCIGGIFFLAYLFRHVLAATAAVIAAGAFGAVALFITADRRFGLKFPWWALLIPVGAALPPWFICLFLLPRGEAFFIVAALAYFTINVILYIVFGGYDSEDLQMFRETVESMRMGFAVRILNGVESFARRSPFFEWYKRRGGE